ncbi:hypothetical protein LCM10_04000 [Rossellomorea aquimaris]|uniref:hypothetical protein n=1 Tax=Rossellomorea aquimaris TaxID=189382 RepID=UPI001CD45227|nr:hypothetical protein [Rossellomorea aquimaris]MCA1054139.1 hypothetical protein [Rossellomorea aquimaris]
MKWIVCLILMIPLLSGCRVILFDENSHELFKPEEAVTLEAFVQIYRNKLLLRGESNLPEGAIVEFRLNPYRDDASSLNIENYKAETLEQIADSAISKVGRDGKLASIYLQRPDESKRYRLEAVFDPRRQDEEVQESFGAAGERLPPSSGRVTVLEQKDKTFQIQKVININKVDEPNGLMAKMRLAPLKELRGANFVEKLELTAVK